MARRWRIPFVEPPTANITVIAFSNACKIKIASINFENRTVNVHPNGSRKQCYKYTASDC